MNELIGNGMGGGCYCGERKELLVAADPTDVSSKRALQCATESVHAEHAVIDGCQIFPLDTCANPICLRLKQLEEQL